MPEPTTSEEPLPLPYQRALRDYLKAEEAALWSDLGGADRLEEAAEEARLQLLRSAYPLEPGMHPSLYDAAATAAGRLGISAPIRLYSAQSDSARSLDLHYVPGEVHMVFRGPLLDGLEQREWEPAMGYGLARFLLAERSDRDFWIAERVLDALTAEVEGDEVFLATAQTWDAYTEIFCDRCAQLAADDLGATLSALRALANGAPPANGAAAPRDAASAATPMPPEGAGARPVDLALRAEALRLWSASGDAANAELVRLVEPPWRLTALDLVGRATVTRWSRAILDRLLARAELRTPPVLALARLFFADYAPPGDGARLAPELVEALAALDASLGDYFAYFLLDFVAVDGDVAELALGEACLVAGELGLIERFREVVSEELGLKRKRIKEIEADAGQARRAEESSGDAVEGEGGDEAEAEG